jgi:hypothetical protein
MIRFIPVEELPEKMSGKVQRVSAKNCHNYVLEFINMNVKMVRIDFDEGDYSNPGSAYRCFFTSVLKYGDPVDVRIRGDGVYLIRKDI